MERTIIAINLPNIAALGIIGAGLIGLIIGGRQLYLRMTGG